MRDGDRAIAAIKGYKWMSPRGPLSIDPKTRDIVLNIYIRKCVKENGVTFNKEFRDDFPPCTTSGTICIRQADHDIAAVSGPQTTGPPVAQELWPTTPEEDDMIGKVMAGGAAMALCANFMIHPVRADDHPTVGIVAAFSGAYAEWGQAYKREIDLYMSRHDGKDGNPKINLILRDAPGTSMLRAPSRSCRNSSPATMPP